MVREGRVFGSLAGKPVFGGSGYFVTAYEVGAQVATGSAGNTVAVREGHGFEALDKGIVFEQGSAARYFKVGSVTATEITLYFGQTLSVAEGEFLVNLGADTGFTAPNYDMSGAVVYTDMDFANVATNSTVQTTDTGRYIYFHENTAGIWELVRSDASTPFALYVDLTPTTLPAASSTDNAVARFGGTSGGALQSSNVILSDFDNMSGIADLDTTGTATLGALAVTGNAVVNGPLLTALQDFQVDGATSLGAVTATTIAASSNITSGGHLRGLKSTAALTSSSNITTADKFLIDITNTSGTNTFTISAPSSVDGKLLILRCVALSAGTMTLADSGNCDLSAAWVPNAGDTLTLVASGSTWWEIARSAN